MRLCTVLIVLIIIGSSVASLSFNDESPSFSVMGNKKIQQHLLRELEEVAGEGDGDEEGVEEEKQDDASSTDDLVSYYGIEDNDGATDDDLASFYGADDDDDDAIDEEKVGDDYANTLDDNLDSFYGVDNDDDKALQKRIRNRHEKFVMIIVNVIPTLIFMIIVSVISFVFLSYAYKFKNNSMVTREADDTYIRSDLIKERTQVGDVPTNHHDCEQIATTIHYGIVSKYVRN